MLNSPRPQPTGAGQTQKASVSGWHAVPGRFADRWTGCGQKPALEQVQNQTYSNVTVLSCHLVSTGVLLSVLSCLSLQVDVFLMSCYETFYELSGMLF